MKEIKSEDEDVALCMFHRTEKTKQYASHTFEKHDLTILLLFQQLTAES